MALDLALAEDAGVEALCPHGGGYVWTRKQAGIPARGTVALDGRPPREIEALAVVDDTAGYHARVTEWRWAAGVGVDPEGTPSAFNLVEGINDPPTGSERAVWVAGEPHEVAAVHFAADLSSITSADGDIDPAEGSHLRFTAEAQRSRRENLLLVRSDYRAPFGTFEGTLPAEVWSSRTGWAWWSIIARVGRGSRPECGATTPGTWRPAQPRRRGGRAPTPPDSSSAAISSAE